MSLYEATLCELAARSSFASTTYSWSSMSAPESSGATLEITLLDSSTPAGQVELALKSRLLDQVGSVQKLGVSIGRARISALR
jgi:hypothetical protein